MTTCENENCDNESKFLDLVMVSKICETCRDEQIKGGSNPEIFTEIRNMSAELVEKAIDDKRTTPEDTAKIEVLPPESDLTVFEETLTEEGLKIIKKESDNLPAIAKTNEQYDQVYDFCTRLKRVSKAARKKEKALQKELKSHFNLAKSKIATDLSFVIDIITPIIDKTIESRDYLECWKIAIKENKARDLAIKQQLEFERQEAIRIYSEKWDSAHEENRQIDDKKRLKLEKERLARERYEFDCEKSRFTIEQAEIEAYRLDDCYENRCTAFLMDAYFDKEKTRLDFDDAWEAGNQAIMHQMIGRGKRRLSFDDAWADWHSEQEKAAEQAGECLGIINDHFEDKVKEKVLVIGTPNDNSLERIKSLGIKQQIIIPEFDKTVPEISTEIDDFQQIMTEKVNEPEGMTDREKLEQIKLSAGIFSGEIEKHLTEGFSVKSNETYINNFFTTLISFIRNFPETDI